MVSVPQENGVWPLPRRLNVHSCRLVACSAQTRKAAGPPGITLVEGMNGSVLTNARQNLMALKQTQTCVFQFPFKKFFKLLF